MTTHYETLDVPRDAFPTEIREAFRRLASFYHPDKPTGDTAKMQAVNEAYRVLMDREARAKYDAQIESPAARGILATVSATDYEAAKEFALANVVQPCSFCDGEREVRVGMGGFWTRKKCPVCAGGQ